VIEIIELTKYYGERRAVGPLSFTIESGEIVGLLGLNGAGKTTTLRILACDLLPSSGTVRVDGLDVVESPYEVRGRVGYLPDVPPLYPEMTVTAYLVFAAELRGLSRAEARRRVPEVLEQTELGARAHDPIASLSHGFKQRVGIAQAIVHKPKLLVLDEPISGLDPVQIVEMRELLRGLRGEHTILVSSHILSEISETCDRLLVIKDGLILASGTEDELGGGAGARVELEAVVRLEGGQGADALEALEALAGELPGVTSIELGEPSASGEVKLVLGAERDVRAELARLLVGAGRDLVGLRRVPRELETVFLELAGGTRAEGRARAEEGARAARGAAGAEGARARGSRPSARREEAS
jgi:ABC-2 type transport system ATP-binding protein